MNIGWISGIILTSLSFIILMVLSYFNSYYSIWKYTLQLQQICSDCVLIDTSAIKYVLQRSTLVNTDVMHVTWRSKANTSFSVRITKRELVSESKLLFFSTSHLMYSWNPRKEHDYETIWRLPLRKLIAHLAFAQWNLVSILCKCFRLVNKVFLIFAYPT